MTEHLIDKAHRMAENATYQQDTPNTVKTLTLSTISHHVDDLEDTLYKSTTTLADAPRPALDNLIARLARLHQLVEEAARS